MLLTSLVPLLFFVPFPQDGDAGKSRAVGEAKITFDGGTDLSKLELGATTFGRPVRPVDLHGQVVAIRTWSG